MKQPSIKSLKRKCDQLFSKWLRSKITTCQLIGKDNIHCGGPLQLMHIETRGVVALRYDPRNCLVGCSGHHWYYTNNPRSFEKVIHNYFPKQAEFVDKNRHKIVHYKLQDYQALLKLLQDKQKGTK